MVRGFREGVKPRPRAGDPARSRSLNSRTKRRVLTDFAFGWKRSAHAAKESRIRGAVGEEVRACRGQAQAAIGPAAHHVGIRLILSVVQPPAHRAELKDSGSSERSAAAAQAT